MPIGQPMKISNRTANNWGSSYSQMSPSAKGRLQLACASLRASLRAAQQTFKCQKETNLTNRQIRDDLFRLTHVCAPLRDAAQALANSLPRLRAQPSASAAAPNLSLQRYYKLFQMLFQLITVERVTEGEAGKRPQAKASRLIGRVMQTSSLGADDTERCVAVAVLLLEHVSLGQAWQRFCRVPALRAILRLSWRTCMCLIQQSKSPTVAPTSSSLVYDMYTEIYCQDVEAAAQNVQQHATAQCPWPTGSPPQDCAHPCSAQTLVRAAFRARQNYPHDTPTHFPEGHDAGTSTNGSDRPPKQHTVHAPPPSPLFVIQRPQPNSWRKQKCTSNAPCVGSAGRLHLGSLHARTCEVSTGSPCSNWSQLFRITSASQKSLIARSTSAVP